MTWSASEGKKFLDSVEGDRLAALWRLLATTGMRRSEVLGLRWANVDFGRARLAVADTVVIINSKPTPRTGETKSKTSARVIAPDERTLRVLREHRQRQLEERMKAGRIWQDNDLVSCREDGSVLSPEWWTRRAKRLVRDADLPWLSIHAGLRHGWATWALEAGIPAKVVQERLGHSSIAITLDRYSHLVDGMDREAAETVAEVFGQ